MTGGHWRTSFSSVTKHCTMVVLTRNAHVVKLITMFGASTVSLARKDRDHALREQFYPGSTRVFRNSWHKWAETDEWMKLKFSRTMIGQRFGSKAITVTRAEDNNVVPESLPYRLESSCSSPPIASKLS